MLQNLTQWYRHNKDHNELRKQAFDVEKKLTSYMRGILGKQLIAISTIYYVGEGAFYLSWNLLPDRLPPDDLAILRSDVEKQFFPYVTDIRNLSHQLFIKWSL